MSSSFVPDGEKDFIPENILLTGGAGEFVSEIESMGHGFTRPARYQIMFSSSIIFHDSPTTS